MKLSKIDRSIEISTASEPDRKSSIAPFDQLRSSQTIHSID